MPQEISVKIAKRLRELRKRHGFIPRRNLPGFSGVDYKHIQLLEIDTPHAILLHKKLKKMKNERKEKGAPYIPMAKARGFTAFFGKHPPAMRVDTLEKLAKALKISPGELLDF